MAGKHWLLAVLAALLLFGCDESDDDAGDDVPGDDDNDTADDDDDDDNDDNDDNNDDDDTAALADEPIVFVQFTDVHQSRGSGTGKGLYENWFRSLQYTHDVIAPDFVVVTGDLTDGSGPGQALADWEDYQAAIADAGFTADDFHDLPGNHDAIEDPDFEFYLNYGVSGALVHAWTLTREFGGELFDYSFIATQTAHEGYVEGRFLQDAFAWTDAALADAAADDHVFLFAHHNGAILPDAGLLGVGGLVDEYDVTAFVAGHRHLDTEQAENGTLYVKTAQHYRGMPNNDDGRMRLFVLYGATWSCAPKEVVDSGPQVIVIAPQDAAMAVTRNPDGHRVTGETAILALEFGADPAPLQFWIDEQGPWAMTSDDNRLFSATFDFGTVAAGAHTIKVETNDKLGTNGLDVIAIESY